MSKKILGASLGSCVHVAGVYRFLQLAEEYGYETLFLGPAVPVEELVAVIERERPHKVIVGYRLYEEAGRKLFSALREMLSTRGLCGGLTLILSCTPALRSAATEAGIFEFIFTGEEPFEEIIGSLKEKNRKGIGGALPPDPSGTHRS